MGAAAVQLSQELLDEIVKNKEVPFEELKV